MSVMQRSVSSDSLIQLVTERNRLFVSLSSFGWCRKKWQNRPCLCPALSIDCLQQIAQLLSACPWIETMGKWCFAFQWKTRLASVHWNSMYPRWLLVCDEVQTEIAWESPVRRWIWPWSKKVAGNSSSFLVKMLWVCIPKSNQFQPRTCQTLQWWSLQSLAFLQRDCCNVLVSTFEAQAILHESNWP